jgi:Holliday junction resolvasome RuvABC endonuclease subunit
MNKKGTVLALDPSLTAFGWVVMRGKEVVDMGCVKTESGGKKARIRKSDERMNRVSTINNVLKEVIKKHGVVHIVSELPHGSQSATAAIALGLVAGAVQAMADFLDLGIEWYSEGDSKKALLGKLSASKGETIRAARRVYRVKYTGVKYKDEAIADSLSVYNAAEKSSPVVKFLCI